MPFSYAVYTGNGSTTQFSVTFPYIRREHVVASLNYVNQAFTWVNDTTISISPAPANGVRVEVRRVTPVNAPLVDFVDGSTLVAADLDTNALQQTYINQEQDDDFQDTISINAQGLLDAGGQRLTNLGAPVNAADAATKTYVDSFVSQTANIANGAVTTAKLADGSVTSAKIVDGTIVAADLASDAVTTAKILDANVTAAKLADNSVTAGKVAAGAITDAKLASGIDGAKLTAGSVPTTALADADLQTLAGMQAGAATALAALTAAEVATLDGITSSTAELNILDGVTADATEINKLDGLTASTSELSQLTGKTISGTLTPGNTNDIPTSSAVNSWVSNLINALGGFVAIPNRNSFPTENPDPSDNAGTVVSVADAGGLIVNASGTATNAQTTGAVAVTITGFPAAYQSTTLNAGLGIQVQTTTTLNTYTFHKSIPTDADIAQLSDDVNDFFARYRVGTTNPTTDLDAGDLFFNTSTGKMLVYDGTTSSWEEVQSIGNFNINTLSSSAGTGGGSASFNGTAYRFTLSNPPLFAQQLLVSVNGVLQKPNSGTSQPAEGFAIDGNDIVFSQAPAASSPFFIVTMGSTVNIGTPSDGTVSTAKLADSAVTTAKINNGAVTTAKLASDLTVDLASGSAASPSLYFDANTGLYSPGEDQVAISTNGSGRVFVDSSGRTLVGTSTPNSASVLNWARIQVYGNSADSAGAGYLTLGRNANKSTLGSGSDIGRISWTDNDASAYASIGANADVGSNNAGGRLVFGTTADSASSPTERMRIDSSGRVGIGTTSPGSLLELSSAATSAAGGITLTNTNASGYSTVQFKNTGASGRTYTLAVGGNTSAFPGSWYLYDDTAGTARFAVDSSGRLLVGTSSARSNFYNASVAPDYQFETASQPRLALISSNSSSDFGSQLILAHQKSGTVGGNTAVASGDDTGRISFQGSDGSEFVETARINSEVDGTPGANDMPGRLVFSTTADGASSPTERMRITSSGVLLHGSTTNDLTTNGLFSQASNNDYYLAIANNSSTSAVRVLNINRNASDGTLVDLRQADTLEGTISVSGTTVSYNGGHLSRWSQLPNNEDPSNILKGTVMSNLDEMCEWGEEDNEQLNKTKVSDVEGDKSVAGVFVSTSFSEDGPLDFFLAMTGDMVIRIAAGVIVERGDLLMSAGDGTAKPQDDDIIRSKTIAKVTSTTVSCTYDDGSYCVPCVLMAC